VIAIRIVETGQMDSNRVSTAGNSGEQARSAVGAKSPAHHVAAVGMHRVVLGLTGYRDCSGRHCHCANEGRTAGLLTIPAMTIENRKRLGRTNEPNRPAPASSGKCLCHGDLLSLAA